jgi:hypothetical protein
MEIYENLSIESLPNEEWRDIVGYEGLYQVSNLGRVKSLPKRIVYKDGREYIYPSKVMKNQKVSTGYRYVTLYSVNGRRQYYVHRLVAIAFIPNLNNERDINHIDGCKTNNIASNLEWCSRSENIKHAYDRGLHRVNMEEAIMACSRPVLQYTPKGEFVAEYASASKAAKANGYNQTQISKYCRKENKRHITYKGYIWRYKDAAE